MSPDSEPSLTGKTHAVHAAREVASRGSEIRRIDVTAILSGAREVVLLHNGEAYRLRITANNKLILTK
jgi:hemin uptake protein HemP